MTQPSHNHLLFIHELLTLFEMNGECGNDMLSWHPDPETGELRFVVLCSDVFAWGSADAEEIDDLEPLRQAREDMREAMHDDGWAACYWTELWVARKRGLRPQGAYYAEIQRYAPEQYDKVKALFDAAGPARIRDILNPKEVPA